MSKRKIKATTLIEILLASAIALIGIVFVLGLASDVIRASGNIRARETTLAEARVALKRLRAEIETAAAFEQKEGGVVITQDGAGGGGGNSNGVHWQAITLDGESVLARCESGAVAGRNQAVAKDVRAVRVEDADKAITITLTLGAGEKRRKLEEVIVKVGETI